MAETLRIEIPIETIDETGPGLSKVEKGFKKAGDQVTQFEKSAQKTQKSLAKWAKEKYEVLLEAKERISPLLATIGKGLKSVTGKAWRITLRAADFATAPIRGIFNLLKNPLLQAGAVFGVSFGLKDTIDTYKSFEAAMSKVQAVSGAAGADMDKLTKKAEEMGNRTKFSATESAEALNYMAMAGWKTKDMLNGIEGIMYLAGASGESLATVSDIVTDAITAFGMQAKDSSHFADVLAVASSNANTNVAMMGETFKYVGAASGALGYSVDDAALAIGLMANSGIKASQAGTELNSIFTRLATNTNGARSAVENLGIKFFDSKGSARAYTNVLMEMRDATKDMTDKEKINFANTVAGTRAQAGLLAMLNATAKDFNKLKGAIEDADGASLDMYNTMQDNLQGALDSLSSKVETVKLSFGKRLTPYIRNFADWFGDQMPALEKKLDSFMDLVDRKGRELKQKFKDMTGTKEWKDADFFGKVQIAWDKFITDPFLEWWNDTGKAKVAGIASNIGSGIGSGLKTGILMLLGIDLSDTLDEAAGVGASFASGFSKGFDFELIKSKLWEGLKNLVSDAGKLLPGGESAGLSSVISAALLAKLVSPLIGIGKGVFSTGNKLFGSVGGGSSLIGSLLGSAGTGTGLLGFGANTAISLGAGNLAGGASLSAGALSALGLGASAGGIAAGASLISGGFDIYHAIKSENTEESNAYGESGAWKIGGVAAGAATGAAIGSVIPVLGTAVGGLIGAGIGGVTGWIRGNSVKKEYEESAEEAEKAAINAQKVLEATGLSIDDVRFKNKDLVEAMRDSEVSASQLALMFQEDCANVMKEAFGDVSLSMEEIKGLAEKIAFGDMKEGLEKFRTASSNTESSLNALKGSISDMQKQNWRASLGMVLSKPEQEDYRQSIDTFAKNAMDYVNNSHYEAVVAIDLLTDGAGSHTGLNSFYGDLQARMKDLNRQLTDAVNEALRDGVVSTEKIRLPDGTLQLSEAEEIASLQKQISGITDTIASAQNESRLDIIRMKFSGAGADAESFMGLQEELKAYTESAAASLDEAYLSATVPLRVKLKDGNLSEEDRKAVERQMEEVQEDYAGKVRDLNNVVETFNLNTIAEAWETKLAGILPNMEGSLSEKLSEALHNAIAIDPDAAGWTQEYVKKMFGLDRIDTSAFEDIFMQIKQTALSIPQQAKEDIIQEFQSSVMGDYGPISSESYNQLVEEYATGLGTAFSGADYSMAGSSVSRGVGDAILNADMTEIASAVDVLKTNTDSYVTAAFAAGVSTEIPVNITAQYHLLNPTAVINTAGGGSGTATVTASVSSYAAAGQTPEKHAAGGYVSGRQLSWLAEEGYGEFVIPTNPSRRARALELYAQAGAMLGVGAHAGGGYVEGSHDVIPFGDQVHNKSEDSTQESYVQAGQGDGIPYHDPAISNSIGSLAGGAPIQIEVHMAPEINIQASGTENAQGIAEKVLGSLMGMVDELGGEMASRLMDVFSNMPMEEV